MSHHTSIEAKIACLAQAISPTRVPHLDVYAAPDGDGFRCCLDPGNDASTVHRLPKAPTPDEALTEGLAFLRTLAERHASYSEKRAAALRAALETTA